MRIMIADDNPVFQSVLKAMLASWGYEVTVASDGDEAWLLLQADDRPYIAVLDWMMPGMDGIEVCRRARTSSFGSQLYILILTAKTSSEDPPVAIDAGADDYVTKPFNSQELRSRLRVACRTVELRASLSAAQQALGLRDIADTAATQRSSLGAAQILRFSR